MKPLIDGDIILYEVGFAAEAGWRYLHQAMGYTEGDYVPIPPFDFVVDTLENRIESICREVESTEQPSIYFTGKGNFRESIATTAKYKERAGNKPFHYRNIKAYLYGTRDCHEVDGFEADDLIAIHLMERPGETICCTRDKDLRQVPGWHYGWELGNQPSFGPILVEGFGVINLNDKRNKIVGWGEKFFYSQMLTGDPVDTIPGIPGMGAVGAFKLVGNTQTAEEAFKAVLGAYKASYGLYFNEVMLEQGRLLWMTREVLPDGRPKLWELPYAIA